MEESSIGILGSLLVVSFTKTGGPEGAEGCAERKKERAVRGASCQRHGGTHEETAGGCLDVWLGNTEVWTEPRIGLGTLFTDSANVY